MRLSILKSTQAAPLHIEFPEGEPSELYPRNAKGLPEFGSVILTLDHLVGDRAVNFHVHQKAVYSTESAAQALESLITTYYPKVQGRPATALNETTRQALAELTKDPENTLALYMVPPDVTDRFGGPIVQVVCSLVALQNLVAAPQWGNSSALVGMNALTANAIEMGHLAITKLGYMPQLMVMKLEDDMPLNVERQSFVADQKA